MNWNKSIFKIAILCGFAIFFVSCEDKVSKKSNKDNRRFPSQVIINANIIQRDSGFVKLIAKAPLIEKYELIDTPYTVARRGIDIQFFDPKKPKNPGKITANYAKMIDLKKYYEAKGNVKITTSEGQTFAMQSIFWQQDKRKIYTEDTVFFTDKNGNKMIYSKGMDAKDDFSEYTFRSGKGELNPQNIPSAQK